MYGERFSEGHALLGVIYPASYNSEQNTSWIAVNKYERIAILIFAGNIGTSLDADVEIATDSGGSNVHTLKSITQLTEAGGDDNSPVCIEIRAEELLNPSGTAVRDFTHLRLELTPNGATLACVAVLGFLPKNAPVATTAWDEVVA